MTAGPGWDVVVPFMFRETARRVALEIARDYAGVVIRRVGADGDTLEEIEITGEDPR